MIPCADRGKVSVVELKRKVNTDRSVTMPERFKVTRSSADLGAAGGGGSAGDVRPRNGRQRDEEAAMGRLLPQSNYPGE